MVMFEMIMSMRPASSAGRSPANSIFWTFSLTPMASATSAARSASRPMTLPSLVVMFKGGMSPDMPTRSSPLDRIRSTTGEALGVGTRFTSAHPASRLAIRARTQNRFSFFISKSPRLRRAAPVRFTDRLSD